MEEKEDAPGDFLVFHLGDEREGIIRSKPDDAEEQPSLVRYLDTQEGSITTISESRKSSLLVPSPMTPRFPSTSSPKGLDTHSASPQQPEEPAPKYLQTASGDIKAVSNHRATPSIDDAEWQSMDTVGTSVLYNDKNEQLVKLREEFDDNIENENAAANGYTRVYINDAQESDAGSIDSMDEQTDFLFDNGLNDMQESRSTASLLTEGQKIAYAALCRVAIAKMVRALQKYANTNALESMQKWQMKACLKLYDHLKLLNEEQLMVEQLTDHGVLSSDLAEHLKLTQTRRLTGEIIESVKHKSPADKSASSSTADLSVIETEKKETKEKETEEKETEEKDIKEKDTKEKETKLDSTNVLTIDVRWTVICDLFLILVMDGNYDARSRALLMEFAKELDVSQVEVARFERKITDAMQFDEDDDQKWEDDKIIEQRRKKALKRKYAFMGAATLGGGLVIGLSAGLLAPVIGAGLAAGFTTIGITGTTGFLAGAGGAALVTTTGAALGARAGLKGMSRRMGHVRTFEFRPLHNNARVNLILTVSGWMTGKEDDVRLPYSTIDPVMGDLLSLYWEPEMMQSMGQTINILATEALTQSVQQLLGATVLTALMASLQLPMALSKLSYLLDNPWNVSLDRAWSAGLIMADTLALRHLGNRPVTLVGFSLGARVIYSCLVELAKRGAYGLVQDVYLFGTPATFKTKEFNALRSVVSGRFVNAYSSRDWILGYLFRATSGGIGSVLGLAPIETCDVENLDVTELVDGHMAYRKCMPKLLKQAGWLVINEEFEEIEDPDPEKMRDKQLKLIAELHDEELDAKPGKFAKFFGFGKNRDWLQAAQKSENPEANTDETDEYIVEGNEMFNLDALRAEVQRLEKSRDTTMTFELDEEYSGQQSSNEQVTEPPPQYAHDYPEADVVEDMMFDESDEADLGLQPSRASLQSSIASDTVPNPAPEPEEHMNGLGNNDTVLTFDDFSDDELSGDDQSLHPHALSPKAPSTSTKRYEYD